MHIHLIIYFKRRTPWLEYNKKEYVYYMKNTDNEQLTDSVAKTDIGKSLKRIRTEKKITQRKLSEEMNCSEIYISNVERELTNPSLKSVLNMVNTLDVPLSTMVDENFSIDESVYGEYSGLFNDLNSDRTLCILKMLNEIKKNLKEYTDIVNEKQDMVAEDIDYKALGNNIEKLREEKNISKSTMAKRLGMNESVYRNIESNNGRASINKYMDIAEKLDVPVDCLFEESLSNKEIVAKHYINEIFSGLDSREKQVISELAQVIYRILRGHGL